MQFDTYLINTDLAQMATLASAIERAGFDGIWTAETQHNPFLPLTLAAEHTQRASLGTAIAVAFARSPTTLAHIAWDLQRYSQGRFLLGLGTQVKAHVVLRYGMRWEKPVRQLRETIEATRAVWESWRAGGTARVGLIGPGVEASHAYERMHKDALTHSIDLLARYLLDPAEA